MSKTYTLNSTAIVGGMRSSWLNSYWTGYKQNTSGNLVGGYSSGTRFATYILFDQTQLAALRSKTITSITLNITIASGRVLGSGYNEVALSYKLNNQTASTSENDAWERGDANSTGASTTAIGWLKSSTTQPFDANNTPFSFNLNGTSVPVYGYVIGPAVYSVSTSATIASSATLVVVTNETDYTYTLSYNANGGSGAPSSQSQTVTATTAPSMAFTISSASPSRTGYTFLGWSTSSSATTASYQPNGSITVNANTTLFAVWKVITYTVSYSANGGSGAPAAQTKTYGVALTLSSAAPTRTGYTFLGWSTSSSATSATYSAGGSYTTNASATLYAVWSIITYTVTYKPGSSGTGSQTTATKTYNVALTLKGATFTRTGYAQTGWATSDGGAQAYALSASYTANASVTLYPVWSATTSTVSTSNGTLGTAQTITITRYNTSYTHDLTYAYGGATGTIATGVAASYSWTPATSLAAQFPSAKSGTCTITCTTKSGSTVIGTSTTTCLLTIPSSVCCTVNSVAVAETVAGIATKFGGFVQGKSKVSLTGSISSGSGSPAYGATVSSYAITVNGQTLTSNGAVTGTLNSSGSNSYSFKVTDSRGYSYTKTGSFTVLAYSAPSVSASINRNRADSSKIDITYSYSISPVTNSGVDKNTKALSVKYKPVGGSETTIPLTASSFSASSQTYQITGLDGNTAYDVSVVVTDYFGSAQTTTQISPSGNRVFDISSTDKTLARHGANQSDGWDHQYFNERFHGVVDVTPRRCYATLSDRGWYRVLTYNAPSAAEARGNIGRIFDFNITRTHTTSSNEVHKISLLNPYYRGAFVDESSYSLTLLVDKIRVTCNETDNYLSVDIHYDGTSENRVAVDFVMHTEATVYNRCVASGLAGVVDSPSNEVELANYTFAANTIDPVPISNTATSVGGTISVPNMSKYKMLVAHTNTSTNNPIGTRGVVAIPVQPFGQVNIPVCTESQSSYIRVQTSGDTLYYTASGITGLYILNLYGIV